MSNYDHTKLILTCAQPEARRAYINIKGLELDVELASTYLESAIEESMKLHEFDFKPFIEADKATEENESDVYDDDDRCAKCDLKRHVVTFTLSEELKGLVIKFHQARRLVTIAYNEFNDKWGMVRINRQVQTLRLLSRYESSDKLLLTLTEFTDDQWMQHLRLLVREDLPIRAAFQEHKSELVNHLASGLDSEGWTCFSGGLCGLHCRRGATYRHVPWTEEFWEFAKLKVCTFSAF